MRIVILIPSEEYRQNAGARIRYGRIMNGLEAAGHSLALEDINSFDPLSADCDALIISKCHDARAGICARVMRDRGCAVGVDLFDDYFSQSAESRMARFRGWLADLIGLIDFALCSTGAMADVARTFRGDLPIHVMNDPADPTSDRKLAEILHRKATWALDNQTINLCWFGMGDNPHFAVGLSDLTAFGSGLADPKGHGFNVRLKILTNARALDARGLGMIAELPVEVEVEEWSERAEADALSWALACFLPVNAQAFSVAKSLNRAVSALNAGCQVAASGFPLYAPLKPLIYHHVGTMAHDLREGRLLLRADTLDVFHDLMERFASPDHEARRLGTFLDAQIAAKNERVAANILPRMAIIHGGATSGAIHKMGQRLGALAVRSPFCAAKMGFDVIFDGQLGRRPLDMFVSEAALARLLPGARAKARRHGELLGQSFWTVSDGANSADGDLIEAPPTLQLAAYAPSIQDMTAQITECFGPLEVVVAEASPLPFVGSVQ